jgi:DNA-binding transcriptional MerR regulator
MHINEASKWSGISRDMIRFYEKKPSAPGPSKQQPVP